MKTKSNQPPADPAWSRVVAHLEGHGASTRNRYTFQILAGKELSALKRKLGIDGRGGDRRSKGQVVPLKNDPGSKGQVVALKNVDSTWKGLCLEQAKISYKTADRYIRRYEKALELSEKPHPGLYALLMTPAVELDGDEVNQLAAKIDELVDNATRADLRIDLRLAVEDACEGEPGDLPPTLSLSEQAILHFAEIPRMLDQVKDRLLGGRYRESYWTLLHALPKYGDHGKPNLKGIRDALKESVDSVHKVISDIETTLEEREDDDGAGPKRITTRKPKAAGKNKRTPSRP